MSIVKLHKIYKLKSNFSFIVSKKLSIFFLKGALGFFSFYLPSSFLIKQDKSSYSFLFLNFNFFKSFINNFFTLYNNLYIIYSLKLKIRGLGFRIRKINDSLFYFFFNYTNLFYFHIPFNILIKIYKKRIILLSNDFQLLKTIFIKILFLKKLGPYRLLGFRFPKQIIFLKKRVKKF
jgi:hypothetical protein